ncbi:MAG: sugar-binding transcriptional regulator [Candidatus Neomarinimicrobiota bacterium]
MGGAQTTILVEAARLYYEHGLSQQQIAQKLGVSRPGVSRLLQSAREQGIVTITINDPTNRGTRREAGLVEKYGLKQAVVVPDDGTDYHLLQKRLGLAAAQLLDGFLEDGIILGVSWGTTLQEISRQANGRRIANMTVVQLNGGVSRAEFDTHASEIAKRIADEYSAIPYLLPLPAIVDSKDVKDAIVSDRNIARTLELARQASVAVFTIGAFGYESVLVKADYFEPEAVEGLLNQGAVGDICSRIITADGKICSAELDQRTIGIELVELSAKPVTLAVAGGRRKLAAIRAGLAGKLFNTLVIDEIVAAELLTDE